jgi:hypothetical protein
MTRIARFGLIGLVRYVVHNGLHMVQQRLIASALKQRRRTPELLVRRRQMAKEYRILYGTLKGAILEEAQPVFPNRSAGVLLVDDLDPDHMLWYAYSEVEEVIDGRPHLMGTNSDDVRSDLQSH